MMGSEGGRDYGGTVMIDEITKFGFWFGFLPTETDSFNKEPSRINDGPNDELVFLDLDFGLSQFPVFGRGDVRHQTVTVRQK